MVGGEADAGAVCRGIALAPTNTSSWPQRGRESFNGSPSLLLRRRRRLVREAGGRGGAAGGSTQLCASQCTPQLAGHQKPSPACMRAYRHATVTAGLCSGVGSRTGRAAAKQQTATARAPAPVCRVCGAGPSARQLGPRAITLRLIAAASGSMIASLRFHCACACVLQLTAASNAQSDEGQHMLPNQYVISQQLHQGYGSGRQQCACPPTCACSARF